MGAGEWHREIWKHYQITGGMHAKALQNLTGRGAHQEVIVTLSLEVELDGVLVSRKHHARGKVTQGNGVGTQCDGRVCPSLRFLSIHGIDLGLRLRT